MAFKIFLTINYSCKNFLTLIGVKNHSDVKLKKKIKLIAGAKYKKKKKKFSFAKPNWFTKFLIFFQ